MKTIHLQLLGQPKILLGDETINNWSSYKALALLAYLATTGETHSRPQLEGLLWGEFEQSKAQSSLRSALYNINKLLDTPLQTGRKTAVFDFETPHFIDVHQFREAIRQGALQTAVDLYQGEFLQGVFIDDAPEFELWVLRERESLRHEYLDALKQLIDTAQAQRRYEEAARLLRQLIHVEPWVESAHRQLMRVLARLGAYNEALRQYEQCEAVLQAELEVEPMPETTALYERILYLRQYPPQNHLPPLPEKTLGREAEIAALTQQLANGRLHTIVGAGGVGKTHLALTIAHDHTRHFLDGVHFVPLAPVIQPRFLASAIANGLNLKLPPNQPTHRALHDYLCSRELLLILDNAEHLLDDCADFCYELLKDAPHVQILVTSRESLQLRQEHLFSLEGLQQTEAVTFFCQRAQRIRHDFTLRADNQEAVRAICQLLAGSPLALELAAAQMAQATPADIRQQIHANLDHLKVQWRDIPDRHRTLRAVFNESWGLLTAVEQTILAQLSVFQAGFTVPAAQVVAQASGSVLKALAAKSLIRHTPDGRYTLHPLVRQFVSEIASEKAIDISATERHATYFCQKIAEQTQLQISLDAFKQLVLEQDNVQKAWETAVKQQNWSLLKTCAHGLTKFHEFTNDFQSLLFLLEFAISELDPISQTEAQRATIAILYSRYSVVLWRTGDIEKSWQFAQKSEQYFAKSGDKEEHAFVLNVLGILSIHRGDLPTAIRLMETCIERYTELGMFQHMVKPQINLSSIYLRNGSYDKAVIACQNILPHVIESGDKRGLAHVYNNMGGAYILLDELESAKECLENCARVCDEVNYFSVKIVALQNLAEVHFKQGAYPKAIPLLEESLALAQELHNAPTVLTMVGWLALNHHRLDVRPQMLQYGREGTQIAFSLNSPQQTALIDWVSLMFIIAHERQLLSVAHQLGRGVLAHASEQQVKDRVYKLMGPETEPDIHYTIEQLIELCDIWDALEESASI